MTTTRIKVADFEQAMFRYVREQVKKANANGSTMLTAAEAKALPKDLRDNFESLGSPQVNASKLMKDVAAGAAYAARRADRNRDGTLSATEAKALPAVLRDNFQNYAAAMKRR